MVDEEERLEAVISDDLRAQANDERADVTSIYTCPDCGGVIWQDAQGPGSTSGAMLAMPMRPKCCST